MSSALERLRELLRAQDGLVASLLTDASSSMPATSGAVAPADPSPASIAASGPRTAARRGEYELLVEAIYEGYLLHYGAPRVVSVPEADLRLLVGDRLYAIGLAQLVELGDTHAVAELADTITLSALAHSTAGSALADAVWAAGARAVGWGCSERHHRAKALVLTGAPGAIEAMRTSAAG